MKRIYALSLFAGLAFVVSMIFNPGFNAVTKRWGKEEFYVYVVDAGKQTLADSLKRQRYVYRLPAVDESGAQKTLTFTSDNQLSLDTYLRLYVSSADKVTAWEEVPQHELPERIKNGNIP